jgi:hypothetical protein
VREIVIVIRDLYLEAQPTVASASSGVSPGTRAMPGIEHLARMGERTILPAGWRAWVAEWLGLPQYGREAPATVAAAALAHPPADHGVWLATALHWVAGMTSLHFDRRSILRLSAAELEALAVSFRETFRGSGFELHPLDGGEFLLSGPPVSAPTATIEPARIPLTSVAESLPSGEGSASLRRLGAEIEMWLHGHSVNSGRARRGAPAVAALWLWGGGRGPAFPAAAAREIAAAAFGSDACVQGLWRLAGGETRPMPVDWSAVLGEPRAQRALAVVEVAELLHANASWSLPDAAAEIDRRLISPSLAALRRGELERLVLVANDRCSRLRASDRWRLWRHMRPVRRGVEGLT